MCNGNSFRIVVAIIIKGESIGMYICIIASVKGGMEFMKKYALVLGLLVFFGGEHSINWAYANEFVDHGNGTVTDKSTGLMWTKNASIAGPISWQGALRYIGDMNSGKHVNYGYTDWRLPTIDEFYSLIRGPKERCPYLPSNHPFINVQCGRNHYWTSGYCTDVGSADIYTRMSEVETFLIDCAWIFRMDPTYSTVRYGAFTSGYPTNNPFYVWPVRSTSKARE